MNSFKDLVITGEDDIEENIVNECSDDRQENNEISQDISEQLFCLNSYYNKLVSLIKRDYSKIKNKDYFNKYYCINSKWMNNFLKLYNYKKIKTLIGEYEINSEEELYKEIKKSGISLNPGYGENVENIKNKIKENFEPEKDIISNYTFNKYKKGELASYYDNFALVNKEFYDKIKQGDKNENEVDICLVDDIFIYKVNENV